MKLKDKNGDPIPLDEAWDNFMVIHGKAEKHVQKIEGEGGDAIASLLMAMVHGGGKNVESVESKR